MAAIDVTYDDYEQLWRLDMKGGMTEAEFSASLPEAVSRVDARLALFDLASLDAEDMRTYKRAVCAACELVSSPKAGSWSAGKASMSYLDGDAATMTVDAAIERCLAGSGLSFTGI